MAPSEEARKCSMTATDDEFQDENSTREDIDLDGFLNSVAHQQPARTSPKRHYKNLAFICICFHLVNVAFLTLQALQSSFNATLGYVALAVLYAFFASSTMIATFLIRMLGPKYIIVFCCFGQCLYIASNYYPKYYTLIPGSIIAGSLGLLWISSAVYITTIATEVAQALKKQASKYISIFMGIFFMAYGASVPLGNAISLAVLLPGAGGLSALANGDGNATNSSMCMTREARKVSDWAFYTLLSIFLFCDVAALVMSIVGLDKVHKEVQGRTTCYGILKELKTSLVALFKTHFNWHFFLIGPMVGYLGFNIGTLAGVILKHFVTECFGVWLVGPTQIVWGLGISISSVVVGRLATKIPRTLIVMVGALGDAATILFLLFWERVPSYAAVFVFSIVFGIGLGVWNTVPASYTGIIAKENQKQTSFSVWQTWISAGFCFSFIVSTFFSVKVNLWCLLGVLVVAAPLYIVTDVASTSDTKDFFKSVLRAVCCYSGLYPTTEHTSEDKGTLAEDSTGSEEPSVHVNSHCGDATKDQNSL